MRNFRFKPLNARLGRRIGPFGAPNLGTEESRKLKPLLFRRCSELQPFRRKKAHDLWEICVIDSGLLCKGPNIDAGRVPTSSLKNFSWRRRSTNGNQRTNNN